MYGTGAYGLNKLFEDGVSETGVEVPPEWMSKAQEGIVGTLWNYVFHAALDQEGQRTDLELSSTVAPFSGIGGRQQIIGMGNPIGIMIDALFMSDKSVLEMIGPSYQLGQKVSTAVDFTGAVLGMAKDGTLAPGAFWVVADEWGRQLLPVYGNFIRGRTEALYDRHITTSGNPSVAVSDGETWARGILGANSRRQRQVNDMLIDIRGLMGHPQQDKLEQALEDEAGNWYKYIKRTMEVVRDQKMDPLEALQIASKNAQILEEALSPDEHRFFFNKVRDQIFNDVTKDGMDTQLSKLIIQAFGASMPSVYDPEFMTELENMSEFEGKEEVINIIEEMKRWQQTTE